MSLVRTLVPDLMFQMVPFYKSKMMPQNEVLATFGKNNPCFEKRLLFIKGKRYHFDFQKMPYFSKKIP